MVVLRTNRILKKLGLTSPLSVVPIIIAVAGLSITRLDIEKIEVSKQRELLSPPKDLQYFTFGYRHLFADLLWIRSLQDFNYCEKLIKTNFCQGQGWLYHMLDLITDLSPHFRMAYSAGGVALTIIVSDIEGASKFFDKAVERFPNDWQILYKAAYHANFEEKNRLKAGHLVERAARNGGPFWIWSLAANLYTEGGERTLAMKLLEELEEKKYDPTVINRMRKRLGLPPLPEDPADGE